MTTIYPTDTCAPPVTVIQPSLHDHYLTMLLRQAIPYLEREEFGTRTNAELRNLITQARSAVGDEVAK